MLTRQIKIVFLFLAIANNIHSQNNIKGFYFGFCPNATFSKVTSNDKFKGLSNRPGPAFHLLFGHAFKVNDFSFSLDLNYFFVNYVSKYNWDKYKSNQITAFPVLKIKIFYNAKLSDKFKLATHAGAGVDLFANGGKSFVSVVDSINSSSLNVTSQFKPINNLYLTGGLGIIKNNSKRDFYIGVSFSKGLFTNFTQKYERVIANETHVSTITGSNTHLAVDIIFFLRKKQPINGQQ
ncbi:MAG: hypothetical protein Q7W45_17620 [Bacteroidota bacterium]|nr:hypothetical protein [Bacteroidota bacterium]MDP3145689.1 hypothetical protein [Bacteroidota bacterium]